MRKKIVTLFVSARVFTFATAAPAFAASIVGSASFPDTGTTQTANLAIQEAGSVATVTVQEFNQTAQSAIDAAFGQ